VRPADRRPLVSVVIVCCNEADLLPGAVRSVSARSARVQIVVVDDGSTDGTAAVARGLDVILVRQSSRGLAAARNHGLQASTGAFVVFLDAADRLLAGAIDLGMRALVSSPDCAMAYGRCVTDPPRGEPVTAPEGPIIRTGHHAALLQTNLIRVPAAAIFRRDAVARAGGFAEGFDGAADYDLYLRISRDAAVIDHGCGVAIGRRGGPMAGQSERLLRDTLAVMRRHRPDPHSPLYGAWRESYARWQDLYGTRLAEEIRGHVHRRAYADAWHKGLVLLTLAPHVMARAIGGIDMPRAGQRAAKRIALPPPSSKLPTSII
jgi:glycosyltransferase involved in cell wall biosynthesis